MALPNNPPISLNQIAAEFGTAPSLFANYGVAPGVPTSGPISLYDFLGKSASQTAFSNYVSWTFENGPSGVYFIASRSTSVALPTFIGKVTIPESTGNHYPALLGNWVSGIANSTSFTITIPGVGSFNLKALSWVYDGEYTITTSPNSLGSALTALVIPQSPFSATRTY